MSIHSRHKRMNPDSDFVLSGTTTSYWNRPGYLNNSQLTTTTKGISRRYNLDSYSNYNPDNYKDEELQKSLRKMTKKLKTVSSRIKDTLSRSGIHTSSDHLQTDHDMAKHSTLRWNLMESPRLQWCTEPVHPAHYLNTVSADLSRRSRSLTPGRAARRYFPVTLGSTLALEDQGYSVTNISDTSLYRTRIAQTEAKIDELLGKFDADTSINKGNVDLILVTPYQIELAHLRTERLRIEEDRLLELKRIEELERIRGPKPKWYEMKNQDFHYEAHKNNELLHSKHHWQDLLTYREDLNKTSQINRNSVWMH